MTNPWLRLQQTVATPDYNLICLPFAGGFAEYFLPWRAHLAPGVQLCPVQLPGRSYRWQESAYEDMEALLTTLIPGLTPLISERPYVLFGHSMGGYIAYEWCKTVMKKALPLPQLLVVSALPAPRHWSSRKQLSALNEAEFSRFFLELGGIQPELLRHESFINMQMALLRSDVSLCESCHYTESALFPFPIVTLAGKQDQYVALDQMAAWQVETKVDFNLYEWAGNHFYLNNHVPALLELIQQRMMIHVDM